MPYLILQEAMMSVSAKAAKSPLNDDELTKVFNEIDDDGNGYITPREAKKAFRKLAEKFNINRVNRRGLKVVSRFSFMKPTTTATNKPFLFTFAAYPLSCIRKLQLFRAKSMNG